MLALRPGSLLSICHVERGLYTLRYVDAVSQPSPKADVTVLAGQIEFVNAPGRKADELAAPGNVLLVVAEGAGEFEMRVTATAGGGTDARFSLDLLDAGESPSGTRSGFDAGLPTYDPRSAPTALTRVEDREVVSVIAHVSRRGDVRVGAEDWVAGPNEVLPIEGLAIVTGRRDLGVRIRVHSIRSEGQWSRWHDPEEFAGSRQQADPLTGIAVALSGDAAPQFEISADVMVLGAPPRTERGPLIEFSGLDPIVGFRCRLNSVSPTAGMPSVAIASSLRVFRAKK